MGKGDAFNSRFPLSPTRFVSLVLGLPGVLYLITGGGNLGYIDSQLLTELR